MQLVLKERQSAGASVQHLGDGLWRLEIPSGPAEGYRWAQLDDYIQIPRSQFHWQRPARLELRARVSAADLPGTWGFGFWNDPFAVRLGVSGTARRLPVLPNAAWFFSAGAPNYLAFRDTHPASGFLAATFSAPRLPSWVFAPALLAFPLLAIPGTARLLRRAASALIGEAAAQVPGDPTQWHAYRLDWEAERARFWVDGVELFSTPVTPRGRLGLVIWLDNQFAAFPPSGKLQSGTSPNPQPAWLEVAGIQVHQGTL
jgi:hypothetical protein